MKKTSDFNNISSKFNSKTISIKRLRTNINVVIDAFYMYFATTRAISQYLLDCKNIKISHVFIYKWTLIDSETRYIIDWYLTTSREATSAFHLFDKVKKRFGAPQSIVSRLPSYNIPRKIVFSESNHIKVQAWYDEVTNNLIESFFKRFKHKYRTTKRV